jgi:pyruvate dehydrogenase E2 component (dihydrolipoamide acetyltransferase)
MQRLPKPDSPASPPQELPEGVAPAASPTIRRIARDLGIDLTRIHGTARGGRIVMGDLRDHIARLQSAALSGTSETRPKVSAPAGRQVDFTRWGPVEVKRASSLRKTIASRMVDSWTRIPHVTQFADADITDLMAMRKKYVPAYKAKDARLTLTPIIFKAVAQVLAAHPVVNSSWDEDAPAIVTKKYIHIGLAVDTEAGLLVPVVRDVDQKSVFELAREIEDLSERSRQRKISKDEMQGGTFTVSNQGGINGAHFTPIINAPEAAILGLGRARELPSQVDGKVRSRLMLPVALAHDHRLVDGADGVRFLVDLIGAIEHFPEAELKL